MGVITYHFYSSAQQTNLFFPIYVEPRHVRISGESLGIMWHPCELKLASPVLHFHVTSQNKKLFM